MSRLRANFQRGTLSAGITNVATSLASAAFAGLPTVAAPDVLAVVLDPEGTAGNPEIVIVTAHSAASTSITVTRGQEGTTARSHLSTTAWRHVATAEDWAIDLEVITDALADDPAFTPSGQIIDSSFIDIVTGTTTGFPGIAVPGLSVVVPAGVVPVTIGWGGNVQGQSTKHAGVSLYEGSTEIDRSLTSFAFNNAVHSPWKETLVDPSGSDRTYTAKLWSVEGSSAVGIIAAAGYPFWMIARAG